MQVQTRPLGGGAVSAEDVLNAALALCWLYAFVRLVMLGIKR